ncbi:hypothetical protein GCM10020295_76290 [Streptomyces cinereospinus]
MVGRTGQRRRPHARPRGRGGQQGTAKVADRVHPSTAHLPDRWERTEEWYNFDPNPRGDVHVLVTADETTYDPGGEAMGADHPISWCRDAEGGSVWATAMGHDTASYSDPLFRDHVVGGVEAAGGKVASDCGPTTWADYEKVPLDESTVGPAALDVADDGRVFYAEYGGRVKIHKPGTGDVLTAATLDVYTGGEDGLTGLALDPDFATNRWIYLMYSPAGGTEDVARVSRFTVNGDTLDRASEEVVMEVPSSRQSPEPGHTGGYITFGPNGDLYIGTGDDTEPFRSDGYAPIDERPGRADNDVQRTSANTNDLRGKILRIHPEDDGTYTVPAGNMFAPGTARTRPEIYAMGFRNPFRFSVDPADGTVYAADYGPDAGSDNAARGPAGIVEWNVIKEPGFYGWPYCVGNNIPYRDYDFATGQSGPAFDCADPVNDSPNNTGLTDLPAAKAADVWYGNGANGNSFPEMGQGGEAPAAFPVYHYDPDNPSETKFPAYFDNTPFFGEWSRNQLHEFRLDDDGTLLKINDFLPNLDFRSPMDMKFGPDGAMYLLEWGSGFGRDNPDSGLYRIDYSSGDRRPLATATATPTSGTAPLTVRFSSEGSRDPEGGTISYHWDFGDGATSDEASPTHTYATRGQFTAQLTVTDAGGRTGTANVTVTSGNTAPTVRLSLPNGGMYDWGDRIPYTVNVTDPEDGTIDCTQVRTVPSLGHDEHAHDTDAITGCSGTVVPETDARPRRPERLLRRLLQLHGQGRVRSARTGRQRQGGAPAQAQADRVLHPAVRCPGDLPGRRRIRRPARRHQQQRLGFLLPGQLHRHRPGRAAALLALRGRNGRTARRLADRRADRHGTGPEHRRLGQLPEHTGGRHHPARRDDRAVPGLQDDLGQLVRHRLDDIRRERRRTGRFGGGPEADRRHRRQVRRRRRRELGERRQGPVVGLPRRHQPAVAGHRYHTACDGQVPRRERLGARPTAPGSTCGTATAAPTRTGPCSRTAPSATAAPAWTRPVARRTEVSWSSGSATAARPRTGR